MVVIVISVGKLVTKRTNAKTSEKANVRSNSNFSKKCYLMALIPYHMESLANLS